MVRERAFYRTIFTLALPTALQGLVSFIVVLADNVMVTTLGDTVYAGIAQSNGVTALFVAIISGLTGGSTVLVSQYWGRKDEVRIRRIFAIVLMICISVAILFVTVLQLWPRAVLSLLTSDPAILNAAAPYMSLVAWSYLPLAMTMALTGMLRSVEIVKMTLYATIVSLFSNVSLNYILIFGKLGLPAMGARGAALATVLARAIELGVVWFYAFTVQKKFSIKPRDLLRGNKVLLIDYLRHGLPVGIVDAQWALVGFGKAAIIGGLGEKMIAANSIAESLMGLGMIFSSSLAGGACVVIGKTVGAREYDKTRAYSKTIQLMFLLIGIVMGVTVFLTRAVYASLYGVSSGVRDLASKMVAIAALSLVGTTYHASCFVGINRGAGDNRFVMTVDMICGWLIVLPVAYITAFVLHVPLEYMFLMLRVDQLFKWVIAFTRLRGNRWIRNVTREGILDA
ncbi:MAG: MATE family efflux transporter [Clostridia bacterium]|nr:MATE family efflux transporter [Clostridia bacterium]